MNGYETLFLQALLLTVVIEATVLLLLSRRFFHLSKQACSDWMLLGAAFLASAATLPYLWFVLPAFVEPGLLLIAFGETAVFIAEALIYAMVLKVTWRQAVILSVACNLSSAILGRLLMP